MYFFHHLRPSEMLYPSWERNSAYWWTVPTWRASLRWRKWSPQHGKAGNWDCKFTLKIVVDFWRMQIMLVWITLKKGFNLCMSTKRYQINLWRFIIPLSTFFSGYINLVRDILAQANTSFLKLTVLQTTTKFALILC